MNRLPRTRTRARPRTRKKDRTHTATRIWAGLVIMMMVVSLFSSLIKPVTAAPNTSGEKGQQSAQLVDTDGDGVTDDVDNCPAVANPDQTDTDGNGVGDACDVAQPIDTDGDGVTDDVDNCPAVSNPDQADSDGNGVGDACDVPPAVDTDADGVTDDVDNCPAIANPDQMDTDANGTGDACDEQEASSVTVNYRLCPEGTDLTADDATALSGACAATGNGTSFNLAGVSADIGTQTTGTAPSSVTFTNVPADNVNLAQLAPPAGGVAIFCEGNTSHGNTKPYARMALVGTSGVFLEVLPGENIKCDWYAMAEDDATSDGSVTLYKWECPDGTDPSQQDPSYYSAECATEHLGIGFALTDGNGVTSFQSEANGYQLDNVTPDGTGVFTLTETIPTGYSLPVVFCQNNGEDPQPDGPALVTSAGGVVTITPSTSSFEYQCFWYNIPQVPGSLTFYKWDCPEGTDGTSQDPSYYSAECATEMAGVPFTFTDGNGSQSTTSDNNGREIQNVIPDTNGQFTLVEQIPPGYGNPVVFCQNNGEEPQPDQPTEVQSLGGVVIITPSTVAFEYQCFWYNIPQMTGMVTIYKWECPEGYDWNAPGSAPDADCTQPMPGVTYALNATIEGTAFTPQVTDAAGKVSWTDVPGGSISITETIPPGYDPHPFVVCRVTGPPQTPPIIPAWLPVATVNGVMNFPVTPGFDLECQWFNRYLGNGEITVYKYTCPEGYHWNAWGADPYSDCTEATNGVTYVLDQPDPGVDLQTDTGDSINGAVYFGGLAPGTYSLKELVPNGIMDVFVWDCVGINTSSVHPRPLSVGSRLDFTIAGGDRIECYWFNVPMPQDGSMLVKKLDCTTPTYVSDVNCTTHTTGQKFDLQAWNGTTWVNVQSGTTDVAGQVTFPNLDPGDYRLVEPGKTACLVKSSSITTGKNIGVAAGAQTNVQVYNCGTATKPPPTTPTKYPNTGAGPDAEIRTGQGLAILGMLGLAGSTNVTRRSFLKRTALSVAAIGGGGLVTTRALASQTLVPLDATVTPEASIISTPAADCLYPATPSAATPADGTPVACARGAVPVHITIETIGVDYPVEYLEIIEGEMVQPTGAENIAWYKETARLGENGNGLYAGHLNWWNMPEGPFFLLETLVEGDGVEIEGDDGETYRYIVQWTQGFPIDEEPPDEALGTSDDEVITLVTCGGEWDADVALYDHRTVVRAIRDSDFVSATPPA